MGGKGEKENLNFGISFPDMHFFLKNNIVPMICTRVLACSHTVSSTTSLPILSGLSVVVRLDASLIFEEDSSAKPLPPTKITLTPGC